jgi:hypothetical protein
MTTDYTEILLARNRTKLPHKVYLHEATVNMLRGFAGGSVSENTCAIVNAFLEQTGHVMTFLDPATRLQISKIRRVITQKK